MKRNSRTCARIRSGGDYRHRGKPGPIAARCSSWICGDWRPLGKGEETGGDRRLQAGEKPAMVWNGDGRPRPLGKGEETGGDRRLQAGEKPAMVGNGDGRPRPLGKGEETGGDRRLQAGEKPAMVWNGDGRPRPLGKRRDRRGPPAPGTGQACEGGEWRRPSTAVGEKRRDRRSTRRSLANMPIYLRRLPQSDLRPWSRSRWEYRASRPRPYDCLTTTVRRGGA